VTKALGAFSVFHGVVLAIGEIARNWGHWQWWPLWTIDFVAAGLIFVGGWMTWRTDAPKSHLILVAGWSFATAMTWMSFASHLDDAARAGVRPDGITWAASVGLAVSSICMISSLCLLGRPARR